MPVASLSSALLSQPAAPAVAWRDHLLEAIDANWRPGEYDHGQLLLVPSSDNPRTRWRRCQRAGCAIPSRRSRLCRVCSAEYRAADPVPFEKFCATPRPPQRDTKRPKGCLVGCHRTVTPNGLCAQHFQSFNSFVSRHGAATTIAAWMEYAQPKPLPPMPQCVVPNCPDDRFYGTGLCPNHQRGAASWIKAWARRGLCPAPDIDVWLERRAEPLDPQTGQPMSALGAVPFGLMKGTSGLELLLALQLRDKGGGADLDPEFVRPFYLAVRRLGLETLIGFDGFNSVDVSGTAKRRAFVADCMRWIEAEHRRWSGTDDRDPLLIHIAELDLTDHRPPGPDAVVDLRVFGQPWISETLSHWLRNVHANSSTIIRMVGAWRVADGVLSAHNKPPEWLGSNDIDAVVGAGTARWPAGKEQQRRMAMLWRLIEYGHRVDDLAHIWRHVSPRFGRNKEKHRPSPHPASKPSANPDEPYRYVPQSVVDWLMDHLHLLIRGDDYKTMEARALIYVHERCGRRPVETIHLREDCISYDSEGHPFLEWERIKPPRRAGKRLPIHQETHDLIRQWQQIKRDHTISSHWLFPSLTHRGRDVAYQTEYLTRRIRELVAAVQEQAPFPGTVTGVNGNLIHYDMSSIDAYALRHAVAQRYADAVDAEGRSTTPPDVLQDLMDHQVFQTTMTYYEVSAKRRKEALAGITPRRLDFLGNVIEINRERDGFTRVPVSLGHCEEPQNVAMGGHGCMLSHACESCPFFRVDPLEREGMVAKRFDLKVQLERATVIGAPQHMIDHFHARIRHCDAIIDGIDTYLAQIPDAERTAIETALKSIAEIRRRASTPRRIDIRTHLRRAGPT
jgi:integrase